MNTILHIYSKLRLQHGELLDTRAALILPRQLA